VPASLIVFSGPPCAGKSTAAALLAAKCGIPHLQMDATRQRIMPDSPHTRADRRVAYRAMHFAAELLLACGTGVILDAPYGHREDREEVAHTAAAAGARAFLIECSVTPETAVRRLAERGPDPVRIDLTPERVTALVREFRFSGIGLVLDSEKLSPEECAASADAWVAAGNPVDLRRWV
jgi:predicted kinase